MGLTAYPNGVSSFGVPLVASAGDAIGGNVYFVSSDSGSDGNIGTRKDQPFATLDYAIGKCTANNGDVIYILPGHTETLATAGAVTIDIAGISIVGMGVGADRPTFTFSATASSILITAASTKIKNIIGVPSIDSVTNPFHVQAADCELDIEWRDASASIEAVRAILTTTAANRLKVNLKYLGYITGNAVVNAVRLVGVDDADINVDFYGICITGVVEMITTQCTDIKVTGKFYVSGTTDLSLNVVDTGGINSTWSVEGFDAAAGCSFSGGSAQAVAKDDVAVVTGYHTVPTADATTNLVLRDVVGNKNDAASTTVATTKTIMAYAKGILNEIAVPTADVTDNAFMNDVVGNKNDAASTTVATTKTIMAYAKGALNQIGSLTNTGGTASIGAILGDPSNVDIATRVKKVMNYSTKALASASLTGTATCFTIAGGPILVRHLGALVTEAVAAGANTLKFQLTPTGGSATDLCAGTDTASAGTSQLFLVSGAKATGLSKTGDVGIGITTTNESSMPLILSPGPITTVFGGSAPANGALTLFMQWEPLTADSAVTVA